MNYDFVLIINYFSIDLNFHFFIYFFNMVKFCLRKFFALRAIFRTLLKINGFRRFSVAVWRSEKNGLLFCVCLVFPYDFRVFKLIILLRIPKSPLNTSDFPKIILPYFIFFNINFTIISGLRPNMVKCLP